MSNKVDDVERPSGCSTFLIAFTIVVSFIGLVIIAIYLSSLIGIH